MTKLDKPLRRELDINGQAHTLTVDAFGLKITEKGRRNGTELRWKDILSGDTAGASALNASFAE